MLGAVLALVVIWFGFAAIRLAGAAADAKDGTRSMQKAKRHTTGSLTNFVESVGAADAPEVREVRKELAAATDSFEAASTAADSPLIAPLKVVPILGRQVRSVSKLSSAAADTTRATSTAFDQLVATAAGKSSTPQDRLATGQRTQQILDELSKQITDVDLGPKDGLVGPLADAYDRFDEQLVALRSSVDRALVGVTGVNQFLTGPSRYLVLASNNAEMRAGSGMYLQAGELSVTQGSFSMSELQPTALMKLRSPGTTLDPDVAALWDWLQPDREWRNINATPRFDQSARMAADMWAASGHEPVDGVLAMDVVGLQQLLQLVGPVQVTDADGTVTTIDADNALHQLLLQQYITAGSSENRRDWLSVVGQAVFSAMNERGYQPTDLLRVLQSSGRGRHLLIWSSDPVEQAGWEALGTSGTLAPDSMLLSVLNRSGNKLDQFIGVDADMTWTSPDDSATGTRRVSVRVTATNTAPDGLPRYVAGPYPGLDVVAGGPALWDVGPAFTARGARGGLGLRRRLRRRLRLRLGLGLGGDGRRVRRSASGYLRNPSNGDHPQRLIDTLSVPLLLLDQMRQCVVDHRCRPSGGFQLVPQ